MIFIPTPSNHSSFRFNIVNILLLSQFFSTTKGGGEYVFKTIAKTMAKNGHKVWVITNNVKDEKYEDIDNLKIIKINPMLEYKGGLPPSFLDNIRYTINAIQKSRKIIKKYDIDLVHSNNFSPALAGSFISYFTNTPHITTIHDIFSVYGKEFWKQWTIQSNVSKINARLVPLFEKLMMKFKIECIHTVSEATKNDIKKLGTDKEIKVIPNCIQDDKEISRKLNIKQFTYLGRLVFYKNIEVILKAFKIVLNNFPDAKLIIAGDGPHKTTLQELVKKFDMNNNIIFTGYVDLDKKKILLAESNALLFPSIIEGFGLVMLEAFQQKRTVVVSNIPPMSDIIENNKTGLIVDPHNVEKWAEAIMELINNPDKSEIMGKNGYQVQKTKYSQELFYKNLIEMYNRIVIKLK